MIGAGAERLGGSGAFGGEDERKVENLVEGQEASAEEKKLSDEEMAQILEDEPKLRGDFLRFLEKNKIAKDNSNIGTLYRGWLLQHKVRLEGGPGGSRPKYSNEQMRELVERFIDNAPLVEQSAPEEEISQEEVSNEPEMRAADMYEIVPYEQPEVLINVSEVTPATVEQLARSGALDIAMAIANNPELRREFEDRINTVVDMDEIDAEGIGERTRNSLRDRFMRLPIARKIVAGVAAVASVVVIATGIFAAAKGTFGSGEVKAATTEEVDLGAVEPILNRAAVDVPVQVETTSPVEEETPSLWEDEDLYKGNVNLVSKDLLALGSESYQNFAEEHPNMVEDEFGAVADYTNYESATKDSPNAVSTSIEAYHDDVDGMKKAILEIHKNNPQALAFTAASMPEFLKQVGGMDEALAISNAGERAAYISKMMTSEGGGDLQKRLYAGFELAVNNENTKGEFENISGPQMSSYIAQVEEMDHNTISNLVPGMSEVTRENDPHFNLTVKFDKLDEDGNVIGDVTYKLAYREVCANIDVKRVLYTEDGQEVEITVFTIENAKPPTPTPTKTEETKEEGGEEETDEGKNAANLVQGLTQGIQQEEVDNTVTQTPAGDDGSVVVTPAPADVTGDKTSVGEETPPPEVNLDVEHGDGDGEGYSDDDYEAAF